MRLPALLRSGELLLVGSILAHIYCEEELFGISGENFTFPVKTDKKLGEVIWTKNKDKVAEWEGHGEPTYFTSLQKRGLLKKETGSLTIFNLENNDTGTYQLERIASDGKNDVLTFRLAVLAPPSEPQISCNISGDNLVLKCEAHFKKPLNYSWKISGIPTTYWEQEVVIPKGNVDTEEKAACFIKYSQMEKSSEISLDQCIPGYKGHSYQKRSQNGLIFAVVALVGIAVIILYLYERERTKRGTGGADQRSVPEEDHLLGGAVGQGQAKIDLEGGKDEVSGDGPGKDDRDKERNKDSCLEDEPTDNCGVSQKEVSDKEKSTLMSTSGVDRDETAGGAVCKQNGSIPAECADKGVASEGGVPQGMEDGKQEHLSNCSPGIESESEIINNCLVDQTIF